MSSVGFLLQEGAVSLVGFWGLRGGDYYGGGYLVVGVEVEELDAGGAAAGALAFGARWGGRRPFRGQYLLG
jgi:hypothetical protein